MNITNADILGALETLKAKYPYEGRVGIQVEFFPFRDSFLTKAQTVFTAQVGKSQDNAVYGWGETPLEAVAMAIQKAGQRDPKILCKQKIDDMKAELAKLENELEQQLTTQTEAQPTA